MLLVTENKLSARSDVVERSVANVERTVTVLAGDINTWRPQLESRVNELQRSIIALQQQAQRPPLGPAATATSLGNRAAAHLANARGPGTALLMGARPLGANSGQGHINELLHRGLTPESPADSASTPVTGTNNFQTPLNMRIAMSEPEFTASQLVQQLGQANPTLQFPVFDGENPQMWQTLTEKYFIMLSIHESCWVPMAILNFSGSPKIWLHSVRKKLAGFNWESFCALLCTRFGRDRH